MTTSLKQLPGTIPALLASRATATPDKPFIVDGVVTLTYKQTQEQAHALAAWLIAKGCTQGDRVAIWAPNCQQWIVAALGAQAIGATVVTLIPGIKAQRPPTYYGAAELDFSFR